MRRTIVAILIMVSVAGCVSGGRDHAVSSAAPASCCGMRTAIDPALRTEIDPIIDAATAQGFAGQVIGAGHP